MIKLRKAKSRSFLNGFSRMWQGWQDSNPQPSVLETAVKTNIINILTQDCRKQTTDFRAITA